MGDTLPYLSVVLVLVLRPVVLVLVFVMEKALVYSTVSQCTNYAATTVQCKLLLQCQ